MLIAQSQLLAPAQRSWLAWHGMFPSHEMPALLNFVLIDKYLTNDVCNRMLALVRLSSFKTEPYYRELRHSLLQTRASFDVKGHAVIGDRQWLLWGYGNWRRMWYEFSLTLFDTLAMCYGLWAYDSISNYLYLMELISWLQSHLDLILVVVVKLVKECIPEEGVPVK